MKRNVNRTSLLAFILIAIYFLGLFVGLAVIGVYPVLKKQKPGLLADARTVVQTHVLESSEDTILFLRSSTTRILAYDAQGTLFQMIAPGQYRETEDYSILPTEYLDVVISGNELFRVMPAQVNPRNITRIWLIAGVPIIDGESIIGAVFLIKNLENLQEAVLAYFIYFTVLFWLAAYFLRLYLRKKSDLEATQQMYIANFTHALKTPNASIKALAETLCDGMQPDPAKQGIYFGMILREASAQEHMIQDILALSRIQSNTVDFSKTYIDAGVVFERIRERYEAICDCAGIALKINDHVVQLPALYTNETCLQQLLELLIDNAFKFVDEGGKICIDASVSGNRAIFRVSDDGIGIKEEELPHVFERFYKGTASTKRNECGSGLGLAIAQEIALNLKEKIWVESELGKGTAFSFTVRIKRQKI